MGVTSCVNHFDAKLGNPKMAILKQGDNQVEVRIKNTSNNTYYDEYVQTDRREENGSRQCQRYIVGEPDTTFAIEVTLKEGYDVGDCKKIRAYLYSFNTASCHIGSEMAYAEDIRRSGKDIKLVIGKVLNSLGSGHFAFGL